MDVLKNYSTFLKEDYMLNGQPMHMHLTAAGWNLLIKETLTPLIEKELQMKQIGDAIWADAYIDGKRRVLSFFKINDASATLKWGWNFNFVPKIAGNKAVFARTDRMIYTHIYEMSADFYNSSCENPKSIEKRDKTMMRRFNIDIKDPENGLKKKIDEHKAVFYHLLPLINEYFDKTDTYENILKSIDQNLENSYYNFINSESIISKIFIEKYIGLLDKATHDLDELQFTNEIIKDELYKRFHQCPSTR